MITRTKYRNQFINFLGDGLYRWNKDKNKWMKIDPHPSARNQYNLVKYFTSDEVIDKEI